MKASLFFLTTDARMLDLIRKGEEEALVTLYQSNRKPILSYITRNNGTADDAEDLLQEALIVLWERVRSGRFEYHAKLGTFVFGTVKNMWLRRLARMKRESPARLNPDEHADGGGSLLDDLIENERVLLVRSALEKLGEQCRKLLLFFYWEELSMEEIATHMGFANADTVKSKKYQCKKELEKIVRGMEV